MGVFTGLCTAALAGAAYGAFIRTFFKIETREDEIHFAETEDGWRIGLSRYRPLGDAYEHPVLLCHGLSANRTTYDLTEEISLARYLAARGFDVWTIDLRGRGNSSPPSWFNGRRYGWSFDDYMRQDIPAAIDTILEQTGAPQLHWLGHSMGGLLLYAYLAHFGDEKLCAGITVGSSLDYSRSPSGFHSLRKLKWLMRPFRSMPYPLLTQSLAPLAGRFHNPPEAFLYEPDNMDPGAARRLLVNTCHSISTPVLAQLSTAMEPGGLRSMDPEPVHYLAGLEGVTTPVLSIAGDHDLQCPVAAARIPIEALEDNGSELLVFGKEHGHTTHYGHFDLLMGKHAPDEVFPYILDWLVEHDASGEGAEETITRAR